MIWSSHQTSFFHSKILHALSSAPIFLTPATSSFSYHLIIATPISLVSTRLQLSALALSGAEVLHVACEPNKQFAWLSAHEKDYLQINAFPDLVVVEREEYPHAPQMKATGGATLLPDLPGGRVISRQMSCDNNARVEGLDAILDNLAVQCTQMDPGRWLDISAWFTRAVNHVLDRSYSRRDNQMVQWERYRKQKTIPRTITITTAASRVRSIRAEGYIVNGTYAEVRGLEQRIRSEVWIKGLIAERW